MNSKKKKFSPTVNRIALNPEQAVLACSCYNVGFKYNLGAVNKYDWNNPSYICQQSVVFPNNRVGIAKCDGSGTTGVGSRQGAATASSS